MSRPRFDPEAPLNYALTMELPKELADYVREQAEERRCSMSSVVRELLDEEARRQELMERGQRVCFCVSQAALKQFKARARIRKSSVNEYVRTSLERAVQRRRPA